MYEVYTEVLKLVRYKENDGNIFYGTIEDDSILQLDSDFNSILKNKFKYEGSKVKYKDVKILEPVTPSKIINFGWTYKEHAIETDGDADLKEPFLFLKPPSSLIADKEEIIFPPINLTNQVEMEGELAIIIGRKGKNISKKNAFNHVFGYTIFNDITARDLTKSDPQFTRGKGFDTFGPLGPHIVKGINPTDLNIITYLNNTVVQRGSTKQMSFSIPSLISWVSNIMTLEPGDVLATGSPGGSTPMKSGDIVTVYIDKVGKLCNKCQ